MIKHPISARSFCLSLIFLLISFPAIAKDSPLQVIDWPDAGTPVLRFTFGKFKQLPGPNTVRGYVMETMAENLSTRAISAAQFSVYLFDKNKVRIGQDMIVLNNVGPGETVKFQTTVAASGIPVSVVVKNMAEAAKDISLTVNSSPQGATLKVDGNEVGTTPDRKSVV